MEHDEFEGFVSATIDSLPDWVQEALHNIEFLVLLVVTDHRSQWVHNAHGFPFSDDCNRVF